MWFPPQPPVMDGDRPNPSCLLPSPCPEHLQGALHRLRRCQRTARLSPGQSLHSPAFDTFTELDKSFPFSSDDNTLAKLFSESDIIDLQINSTTKSTTLFCSWLELGGVGGASRQKALLLEVPLPNMGCKANLGSLPLLRRPTYANYGRVVSFGW